MTDVLRAFEQECAAIDATLATVPSDGWGRPGLGEWTVAELVAHLVRGATRIGAYLDVDPGGSAPVCDRVGYFRFDLAAAAPEVAERARQEAAAVDAATLPALFAAGWRSSAERASGLPPDHLVATLRGPMALEEYAATRVVEMVVHHMDLCAALDRPPAPTPTGGKITMELLEGLLGGPRPRNMGRTRFVLAATGRIPTDDPRLPVLR